MHQDINTDQSILAPPEQTGKALSFKNPPLQVWQAQRGVRRLQHLLTGKRRRRQMAQGPFSKGELPLL
jgi:hypothetical protein